MLPHVAELAPSVLLGLADPPSGLVLVLEQSWGSLVPGGQVIHNEGSAQVSSGSEVQYAPSSYSSDK